MSIEKAREDVDSVATRFICGTQKHPTDKCAQRTKEDREGTLMGGTNAGTDARDKTRGTKGRTRGHCSWS